MKTAIVIWGLIWGMVWTAAAQGTETPEVKDYRRCLACHAGVETLDRNHAFACEKCHLKPEDRTQIIRNHGPIIRHPAAPATVDLFCGKCHRRDIDHLQTSLHWTLTGIISQTRYLWGAQPDPRPRYGALPGHGLKRLPPSPETVRTPADLVDDLLRQRCLSCHVGTPSPSHKGLFHGVGCAACHVFYADDGRYRGKDHAISGKRGYPVTHTFCRPIPTRQCRHCHNGSAIGGDYTGRFPRDDHQSYHAPIRNGVSTQSIYLADHHRLTPDVHHQRGLLCVDCHSKDDVMGTGTPAAHQEAAVSIRCRHCHDISNDSIVAHAIPGMEKVHCLGCHSRWSFMDYGQSLIRDDRPDLSRWAPWRLQGDAGVADLFDRQGQFQGASTNSKAGTWFRGWRFRRWEYLTLGKDAQGRIVPFRPRYQYRVSFIDRKGNVILDDVVPQKDGSQKPGWAFMPIYPHTVQRFGRPCEACHGQPLAAGMGLWKGAGPDLALTCPSPPVYPTMSLLSESEQGTLLEKTTRYRKWRFKVWRQHRQD